MFQIIQSIENLFVAFAIGFYFFARNYFSDKNLALKWSFC